MRTAQWSKCGFAIIRETLHYNLTRFLNCKVFLFFDFKTQTSLCKTK